jgi:hypothetical protein
MNISVSQQLTFAILTAIQHVQKHETVTYDDVWEATAALVAQTLILSPKTTHEDAIKDLSARAKNILIEYVLDHPRGGAQ